MPWQHHVLCVAEMVQKLSVVGFCFISWISHCPWDLEVMRFSAYSYIMISAISPLLWIHSTVNEILILSKWHPILGFLRIDAPVEHLWLNSYHTDMRSVRKDLCSANILGSWVMLFISTLTMTPLFSCHRWWTGVGGLRDESERPCAVTWSPPGLGRLAFRETDRETEPVDSSVTYVPASSSPSPALKHHRGLNGPACKKTKQKEEEKNTVKKS